jgi:hypothetical protein
MTELREAIEELITRLTSGEPDQLVDATPAACEYLVNLLKANPASDALGTAGSVS